MIAVADDDDDDIFAFVSSLLMIPNAIRRFCVLARGTHSSRVTGALRAPPPLFLTRVHLAENKMGDYVKGHQMIKSGRRAGLASP